MKSRIVCFRPDLNILREIEEYALLHGYNRSQAIEKLLKRGLESEKPKEEDEGVFKLLYRGWSPLDLRFLGYRMESIEKAAAEFKKLAEIEKDSYRTLDFQIRKECRRCSVFLTLDAMLISWELEIVKRIAWEELNGLFHKKFRVDVAGFLEKECDVDDKFILDAVIFLLIWATVKIWKLFEEGLKPSETFEKEFGIQFVEFVEAENREEHLKTIGRLISKSFQKIKGNTSAST